MTNEGTCIRICHGTGCLASDSDKVSKNLELILRQEEMVVKLR